jgi:hypothetical protein
MAEGDCVFVPRFNNYSDTLNTKLFGKLTNLISEISNDLSIS